MIGPVLVDMRMHVIHRRQFVRWMRVSPSEMIGMIMTSPQVLRPVMSYQQAFSMMPAIAKDIVILFALGSTFLFIQAKPFTVWMFLHPFGHQRSGQDTIARG